MAGRNSDEVVGRRWVASERTPVLVETLAAISGCRVLLVAVAGNTASVAMMDVAHHFNVVIL